MAKRLTVFYSWQSDTPSNLNRNFIEKAIQEALKRLKSDAELQEALRDADIILDKDTKGIAGSPPITDTILKKIEGCAVFIADLTFVGESKEGLINAAKKPRSFPNPNVLIEYGYALRCHTHTALIGIMNTAYGEPDAESLPFNLRHFRRPMTYRLGDGSTPDKIEQFEKVVGMLVEAIGLILSQHSLRASTVEKFVPQKATINAAVFYDRGEELVAEGRFGPTKSLTVADGAKAYLRLYPTDLVPPIDTEMDATLLVRTGNLVPMGYDRGYSPARNMFGGIVYEAGYETKLYHLTQLFLSREIWGIDAGCIYILEPNPGHVESSSIEENFVNTLQNYLQFAQDKLQLPLPLQVEAGLVGIKGYQMLIDNRLHGKFLHDSFQWKAEITSYENPALEILEGCFKLLWSKFGIPRPPERQIELAQQFASSL